MDAEQNEKKRETDRDRELDRFWDIEMLLPTRRPAPISRNTDAAEIRIDPREAEPAGTTVVRSSGEAVRLPRDEDFDPAPFPRDRLSGKQPESEYDNYSRTILRVRIFRWKSTYSYYEDFVRTAEHLHSMPGRECEAVPFFSFVPQYAQMSREQLSFYLWWRECLRRGKPIRADYSYVLLYLYELINLSEQIPPAEVQEGMLTVFRNYREQYPQLRQILPDWICDHALIHHISAPACDPATHTELFRSCQLREFYSSGTDTQEDVRCLLASDLTYDYRKSKFYTGQNRELYDRVIPIAMTVAMTDPATAPVYGEICSANAAQTVVRDSYVGALCSYRIKRRMEVTCLPLYRMQAFRTCVGETVRYIENGVRAHLGIRSRLNVGTLPQKIRDRIDRYFAETLPPKRKEDPAEEERQEYEKLYDLPSKPFSEQDAAEIERLSWDTTRRLIEAFEAEQEPVREEAGAVSDPEPFSEPSAAAEEVSGGTDPFRIYRDFLRAALAGDVAGERRAADALGKLPDAVAGEINDRAADLLGDVLLEEIPGGYAVLEDYREDAQRLVADK